MLAGNNKSWSYLSFCSATPCATNPCKNGGTCTVKGVDSFVCECTGEFYGERCEEGNMQPLTKEGSGV